VKTVEALREFREELDAAERKFPRYPRDAIHAAAIVAEESGELVQAALQFTYEGGSYVRLRREAIQVGAMALRFLLHLDHLRSRASEQVERLPRVTQQGDHKTEGS
jgi:hypothetical protein